MKFTDGNRTIDIGMRVLTDNGFSPDWSDDFFEVGNLWYDEEKDAYVVEDVQYCLDYAMDWQNGTGDFAGEDAENNFISWEEV